jgi:hypothetical protein
MHKRLPTVLSLTALVVAVLGVTPVGEAARDQLRLPRNSVGTVQLKQAAVTSIKVKNGSLLVKDFMPGQIPAGPAGPAGPQGPAGASAYQTVFATGAGGSTPTRTLTASCPAGKRVLGGGVAILPANVAGVAITSSYMSNPTTWTGSAREIVATASNWSLNTVVICANMTS